MKNAIHKSTGKHMPATTLVLRARRWNRARHLRCYQKRREEFLAKARALGHTGLENYYWYHTIDLPGGLTTPGMFDYRNSFSSFGIPNDLRNKRVLDVGSATGFFAFECAKRGADVTSVELPSMRDWDWSPQGRTLNDAIMQMTREHGAKTEEELFHYHLDGPFLFCRDVLDIPITRVYRRVYDLTLEEFEKPFDLVMFGDVLLHVYSPLEAITALAPLCKDTCIITQPAPRWTSRRPLMEYRGHLPESMDSIWWLANFPCIENMLKSRGFREVSLHAEIRGKNLKYGSRFKLLVVHGRKSH